MGRVQGWQEALTQPREGAAPGMDVGATFLDQRLTPPWAGVDGACGAEPSVVWRVGCWAPAWVREDGSFSL